MVQPGRWFHGPPMHCDPWFMCSAQGDAHQQLWLPDCPGCALVCSKVLRLNRTGSSRRQQAAARVHVLKTWSPVSLSLSLQVNEPPRPLRQPPYMLLCSPVARLQYQQSPSQRPWLKATPQWLLHSALCSTQHCHCSGTRGHEGPFCCHTACRGFSRAS